VSAPYEEGEGYFGIAPRSLAIHVAAWRAQHAVVRLLIERGSPIEQADINGRTPLALAVRACVDSFWMARRSPESVQALLSAGASAAGVPFPSGYAEVDALLNAASS
jgi:ankyrin repeat protein